MPVLPTAPPNSFFPWIDDQGSELKSISVQVIDNTQRVDSVSWGDGSTSSWVFSQSGRYWHTYPGNGDYIISYVDEDGTDGGTLYQLNVFIRSENSDGAGVVVTGKSENDALLLTRYDDLARGGSGSDLLAGWYGNDTLYGGSGDDGIAGGDGVDTAIFTGPREHYTFSFDRWGHVIVTDQRDGGDGKDTLSGIEYLQFASGTLSLEEALAPAPTSIQTSTSFTLPAGALNLTGMGTADISLTGNNLSNVIIGNAAKNAINGLDGDDKVNGGLGNDSLSGGTGKDSFQFTTKLGTSKTDRKVNFDKVTDFSVKDDGIQLDNAVFKKLGSGSASKPKQLSKAFFTTGDKAKDGNDYVIYNKKTGVLSYDADGSGSKDAVEFAQLKKGLGLKYTDFFVI